MIKKNIVVGLTGGIGSGKTSVAKIIESRGYPVYYSDIRAKEIANDDIKLKSQIISLLGDNAYNKQGQYNRKWVGEQVFADKILLDKLNHLIHPAVRKDYEIWSNQQTSNIIFKETALLFELNLDKQCNKTLLVTANDHLRIKRVMERDGKTYREVETIMQKQMPEKDKVKYADFIIYNNEDLEALVAQTIKILDELQQ